MTKRQWKRKQPGGPGRPSHNLPRHLLTIYCSPEEYKEIVAKTSTRERADILLNAVEVKDTILEHTQELEGAVIRIEEGRAVVKRQRDLQDLRDFRIAR